MRILQQTVNIRPFFVGFVCYAALVAPCDVALAQVASVSIHDPTGDAVVRPTDYGRTLAFDLAAHRPVDLLRIRLGRWLPQDALADLFTGDFADEAPFVRLDLELVGLINPPGYLDDFSFAPFLYGPHPVFGFVEIDMDDDVSTGGELEAPQYRYLGNVARFGGHVQRPEFRNRVALDGAAFDGNFQTPPFVERHGEEFHLALLGNQFEASGITEIEGNRNWVFEAGETWVLRGTFFHRAHGFEPFSFVEGGRYAGEYMPMCDLQFQHRVDSDVTSISLVFPLTNAGAAMMRGEPPEGNNEDPTDQASVYEALEDLQTSAIFLPLLGTGIPEEDIIRGWAEHIPAEHLDPAGWSVTAILGSSFTEPGPNGVAFLWTDVYPNVVLGDVDGSGLHDAGDRQLIAEFIARRDAADGVRDGVVTIRNFADDFSVYDVDYDGRVDALDMIPQTPDGDADGDGDWDLFDFALLQRCFGGGAEPATGCHRMDIIRDFTINLADTRAFNLRMEGPLDR